jgi:anti-sigma factor RsiW
MHESLSPPPELCPTDLWLARFASNDAGPQRKRKMTRHVENCAACRAKVARHHEMSRRYREFERQAIAAY